MRATLFPDIIEQFSAMSYADLLKEFHISVKRGFVLEHPVTDLDDAMFREWRNLCSQLFFAEK